MWDAIEINFKKFKKKWFTENMKDKTRNSEIKTKQKKKHNKISTQIYSSRPNQRNAPEYALLIKLISLHYFTYQKEITLKFLWFGLKNVIETMWILHKKFKTFFIRKTYFACSKIWEQRLFYYKFIHNVKTL